MNILEQFKIHISEQYQITLGLGLVTDAMANNGQPVWISDTEKAWLLDDEIGLALRIVPYSNAVDELNTSIQEAVRAATQLQPHYGITDAAADKCGIWQVSICWLVEANLREDWRKQIAEARKESGFSEEIGLDAILCNEGDSIADASMRHGLPQLLLQTRRLLKLDWDEMPSWLSANTKVAEMLNKFPSRFSGDTETYKLAHELAQDVLPLNIAGINNANPQPNIATLEEITIKNFRNIGDLHLPFPKNKGRLTQAHVMFGPNGTGKTSIFEALCLAAGGASNTLVEYLDDKDVESRKRSYITSVLSPLGNKSATQPTINLNGNEKSISSLDVQFAKTDWDKLEGSFQAQEDSRLFLQDKGESMAQRILKNYSTMADEVTKHAEARATAAKEIKTDWLRKHDLNASISVRETRSQRLIEGEIKKESWLPPQSMLDWLKKTTSFFPEIASDGQHLVVRWQRWKDSQSECIEHMSGGISLGEVSLVRQTLATWLAIRNALLTDTRALVARAVPLIEPLRDKLLGVEQELDAWGEWLNRQASQPNTNSNAEQNQLSQEIAQARIKLGELRLQFALERKHATYLEKIKADFLSEWVRSHPDTCPTCGQDHHDHGGINRVVDGIKSEVEIRLAEHEMKGKALAVALAEMEAKLASFGICPVSELRQKELHTLLTPFCADASLQTLLTNTVERSILKTSIQSARILPDVPEPLGELEENARRIAEQCMSLDAEAERLWKLPEQWVKIVKALKEECDAIVAKHLPDTIQKLWWEIALTLTPARWNLAATPTFQINRGRNIQKLVIGVLERDDTPARYLFNQAERHIMGLAWFFTRYLTHGRFHRAFIVLDDPAQEMDQTTFRSFARFIQMFLRLQEKKQIDTQLVLFLHQEDRALDMARATLGRFIMLSWSSKKDGSQHTYSEVRLLSEGFKPQIATQIIGKLKQNEVLA